MTTCAEVLSSWITGLEYSLVLNIEFVSSKTKQHLQRLSSRSDKKIKDFGFDFSTKEKIISIIIMFLLQRFCESPLSACISRTGGYRNNILFWVQKHSPKTDVWNSTRISSHSRFVPPYPYGYLIFTYPTRRTNVHPHVKFHVNVLILVYCINRLTIIVALLSPFYHSCNEPNQIKKHKLSLHLS